MNSITPAADRFWTNFDLVAILSQYCGQSDISALARVSRSFHNSFESLLYQKVGISLQTYRKKEPVSYLAIARPLQANAENVKELAINGYFSWPREDVEGGEGDACILEIIRMVLPRMRNLRKFLIYGNVELPKGTIETISRLERLEYIRLQRDDLSSCRTGGFPRLYRLQLTSVTHMFTGGISDWSSNLTELSLLISEEVSVLPEWFLGLNNLKRLKVNRGYLVKDNTRIGSILPSLESLEVCSCRQLGWLRRLSKRKIKRLSFQAVPAHDAIFFLDGLENPLQELRLTLWNEAVLPNHLISIIQRHGRSLHTLLLDGVICQPLAWYVRSVYMRIAIEQWRSLIGSLPNLVELGIRPMEESEQVFLPGTIFRLSDLCFPFLPKLTTLHLLGMGNAEENVLATLHCYHSQFLHKTQDEVSLSWRPCLRELVLDGKCYKVRYHGGMLEHGGSNEERISLVDIGTRRSFSQDWI